MTSSDLIHRTAASCHVVVYRELDTVAGGSSFPEVPVGPHHCITAPLSLGFALGFDLGFAMAFALIAL